MVTPFSLPTSAQGSSDFCVDPDAYVTRMVEELSVLSGGEPAAAPEPARGGGGGRLGGILALTDPGSGSGSGCGSGCRGGRTYPDQEASE